MSKKFEYSLSFATVSFRFNEMVKMAKYIVESGILDFVAVKDSGMVFGSLNNKTSFKRFSEIRNRLEKLTHEQLHILAYGDLSSQKQIAFLSVCKLNDFVRDFAIEVVRDKVLVFDYKILDSDYKAFISNKIQLHPKLEEFSETTLKKAKQVMFFILQHVGIINNIKEKLIQPQLLQPEVIKAIVEDNPAWMKIFMMSDKDIDQLKI